MFFQFFKLLHEDFDQRKDAIFIKLEIRRAAEQIVKTINQDLEEDGIFVILYVKRC